MTAPSSYDFVGDFRLTANGIDSCQISKKLTAGGLLTVQDLRGLDLATVRRQFSVVLELQGIPCIELEHMAQGKKE